MAAEETLEKEQLAAEKRLQEQIEAETVSRALDQDQKTNDQQNAINMENQEMNCWPKAVMKVPLPFIVWPRPPISSWV